MYKLNKSDREILNKNLELFNKTEDVYKEYIKNKNNKKELFALVRSKFEEIRNLLFEFSDCDIAEDKKFDRELNLFQSYINRVDDLCLWIDRDDDFMIEKCFEYIEKIRKDIYSLLKKIK